MATPSSSATSPSPTLPFAPPLSAPAPPPDATEHGEQFERKRTVEKFKARAEISNVTRSLRARLSYASYKATHNVANVPLRELEAQSQGQIQIYARTMAAKRKASAAAAAYTNSPGGNNNYYNNPATQGGAASGSSGVLRRPGAGPMAPPPSLGPRSYYPGPAGGSGGELTRPPPAQSLFTSILAPPPSHQARTILNVGDPPVPPSSRPTASPHPRSGKAPARSIAEGTRAMHRNRTDGKHEKRKARHSLDKGKQKQPRVGDVDADGDIDMKAAATLTSLLLNHRPSIGSASSPRSSLDESETGSTQSYSHFAQSSARHVGTPGPPANAPLTLAVPEFRRDSATPPLTQPPQQTTPRPAPTDNEAADLMLFLATSPSPVRKDQRDLAAYRALNGVRPKGRVLFPTASGMADADGGSKTSSALARGTDSFTSSVSSIGGEMRGVTPGGVVAATESRTSTPAPVDAASPPPAPAAAPPSHAPRPMTPAQLLPPPPLPAAALSSGSRSGAQSPALRQEQTSSPKPSQPQQQQQQVDFNFNDFLHPSPSPARGGAVPVLKQSLGLRADVGRKLFEEEQMRHVMSAQGAGKAGARADERALGAGIDLVQSRS
ncbi:hypothetical protein GGX14DRAFT_103415 [Mycena pura]|uniref:Uncharacterized protein n=1 Tax=Mycena pura TaxID=153505 RepID=A0AAD6YRY3_9AGAR|nr:hypothetical protein GGX14DRAFT_103415 [Mycena pura]